MAPSESNHRNPSGKTFGTIGAVAIVMAVALFLVVKPIKSLMSGGR